MSDTHTSAGHAIAKALRQAGMDRAFLVPGESYLPLLEGMREENIMPVVCRNEGGASYMALADAMVTGRPGIAMVTRGPGAANAMVGVSAAWQDGVPLVLFVGLVNVDERDRSSFQEFDLRGWFGTTAKRIYVLDAPERAYSVIEEALRVAMSGRPGPVVIGLPEDVLALPSGSSSPLATPSIRNDASREETIAALKLLEGSQRPLLVVGGRGWSRQASDDLTQFSERHCIPVLGSVRAGDRLPEASLANAGWLGFGAHEEAWQLLEDCDALLVIGTTLGDVATRGWTIQLPHRTIVISPDPELRGHAAPPQLHIVSEISGPLAIMADTQLAVGSAWAVRQRKAHDAYVASTDLRVLATSGPAEQALAAGVFHALNRLIEEDVTVAYGAGQHCIWPQRYVRKASYPSELGLQNGSMGFSVPAAIAASLRQPDRLIVCVAGDGELLMNGQELATAQQMGAAMVLVIIDNGSYGTIRDHQEDMYPGTRFAVDLENPDFAAFIRSFGGDAFRVEKPEDVEENVLHALASARSGMIAALHVITHQG